MRPRSLVSRGWRNWLPTWLKSSARSQRSRIAVTSLEDRITPVADQYEPNNTFSSANYLGRGGNLTYSSLNIDQGDVDWLQFRIDQTGAVGNKVGIEGLPGAGDLDIELYNSNNVLVGSSAGSTATEFISMSGRPAGNYFLRVSGFLGATGDYTFRLFGPNLPDAGDFFELNDQPFSYTTFPASTGSFNISGMSISAPWGAPVNGPDTDWFLIRTNGPGTSSNFVSISSTQPGDIDLHLYNFPSTTNPIRTSTSSSANEKISFDGLPAGNYFAKVYGFNGARNSNYRMDVNFPAKAVGDRFETNNSLQTATFLARPDGGLRVESNLSIAPSGDNDFFRFTLEGTASFNHTARIDFSHQQGDIDLELLNSNGEVIRSSGSVSNSETIELAGLGKGDYFLRVFGFLGATNPNYTLSLLTPPAGPVGPAKDRYEPNDSRETATDFTTRDAKFSEGQLSIHEANNDDWYKFKLSSAATSTNVITANFRDSDGDLDIVITDAKGVPLRGSFGVTDVEQVSLEGLSAGTYFLRVSGYEGATNPDYQLNFNLPIGSTGNKQDQFEPNDTRSEAKNLGQLRGQTKYENLSIHAKNNDDFYSFTLASAGSRGHGTEISFSHKLGDVDLELLNTDGKVLRSSDSVSNREFVSFEGLAAGNYVLRVFGFAGATNPDYDMVITAPESSTGLSPDEFEVNNTLEQATVLRNSTGDKLAGSFKRDGLTITSKDVDIFKFTTAAAGTQSHSVSINLINANGNLDLELLDSKGAVIGKSIGARNVESIPLTGLAAGTYFMRVFGAGDATNKYSLAVDAPLLPTTPTEPTNPGTSGRDAWTIMVYMTASDLHTFAFQDINEMEIAASKLPGTVNIAVLWDQSANKTTYSTGNGAQAAWGTTGRAIIAGDTNKNKVATNFELLPEQNTGNAQTVTDFVNWASKAAPAEKYAFVYWDHGAGIFGANYDDQDKQGSDNLNMTELVSGLVNTKLPLSLVSFDACLMGMVDVAYQMRDVAPVFAAAEEVVPGNGHDYTTLFNTLQASNPYQVSAEQLGSGFVASYGAQYKGLTTGEDTYSAIRTSKLGDLAASLKSFVDAVGTSPNASTVTALQNARNAAIGYLVDGSSKNSRDLGSFMAAVSKNTSLSQSIRTAASGVQTKLNAAIIAKTNDRRSSSGLAIYAPAAGKSVWGAYTAQYAAFTKATGWDQLLGQITRNRDSSAGRSVAQPDFIESNDSSAVATDFGTLAGTNVQINNLNLHDSEDQDWFRFEVATAGTVTIAAQAATDESIRFELYEEIDGELSLMSDSSGNDLTLTIDAAETERTYFINMRSADDGGLVSSYKLNLDLPGAARGAEDDFGENDTPEKAFPLGSINGDELFPSLRTTQPNEGQSAAPEWYLFESPRLATTSELLLTVEVGNDETLQVSVFTVTETTRGGRLGEGEEDDDTTLVLVPGEVVQEVSGSGTLNLTIPTTGNSEQYFVRVTSTNGAAVPFTFQFQQGRAGELAPEDTEAPTIQSIPNQTGTGPFGGIAFTIADNVTPTDGLQVTFASSNATLIPVGNIQVQGSGSDRKLQITPAAGQTGASTITVSVRDQVGLTTTSTFDVTVTAPPPPVSPPPVSPPPVSPPPVSPPPVSPPPVSPPPVSPPPVSPPPVSPPPVSPPPVSPPPVSPPPATSTTRLLGVPTIAIGDGSKITFLNADRSSRFQATAFDNNSSPSRTASADFNNDGVPEAVVATGPGSVTRVRIIDGVTQKEIFSVQPFESGFTGGIYVSAGDVNGDGRPDLAITPDEGGGPRVDIYDGARLAPDAKIISFFGIDDPNFRGGARASIADMNGDGASDLLVVAGFGGGPRVAGFDGKSLTSTPRKIFGDFFAFEQTLRNGVFVTAGDINGDGFADLIAGGGPGGGPRVLGFDGKSLLNNEYKTVANFFAGDVNSRSGVRLAVKNLDNDNRADIVISAGDGSAAKVIGYLGKSIAADGTPPAEFELLTLPGAFVG